MAGVNEDGKPNMTSSFWFDEDVNADLGMRMRMTSLTFDEQSDFQRVQVIETKPFGKTLVLDGKTQSCLKDEYVYHETLVHPAMLLHGNPKRVYIGGGGELATARECLKHKSVEEVVMVDLDGTVVDVCKKELPEWNAGSTEDPRLDLRIGDAKAYLESAESGMFDVIVLDICDPVEAGPAVQLYTLEFYQYCATKLNPGGILVTQSGPGGLITHLECFGAIYQTLKRAFNVAVPYAVTIPSFGSDWAFTMATNVAVDAKQLKKQDPDATDAAVAAKINGALRHYDGDSHLHMFNLIKTVRDGIEGETRVITIANPVFMY